MYFCSKDYNPIYFMVQIKYYKFKSSLCCLNPSTSFSAIEYLFFILIFFLCANGRSKSLQLQLTAFYGTLLLSPMSIVYNRTFACLTQLKK